MVGVQLFLKGLVCGLGEQRLLLQNGQNSHRLLKHVNAFLQVHSEVYHGPLDACEYFGTIHLGVTYREKQNPICGYRTNLVIVDLITVQFRAGHL